MGLFNNYNEIEKQLLEHYTQFFTTMSLPDAKKTAKDMLNKAIEESKEARTYYLPHNFGDIMLGIEKAENLNIEKVAEIFRKVLPVKRAEGVKDEDIRWWWNLNDVERKMMLKIDEFYKLTLFMEACKNGKSEQEAGKMMWEAHPMYTEGDPNIKPEKISFEPKREDYRLPIELKDRVNRYIEKRANEDPEKIKQDLKDFSTFNAFIRKEIRAGNI